MSSTSSTSGKPPLILTLDIGSSSVRALLFDRRGRVVPDISASEKVHIHTAADGTAEIDPAVLLAQVERCVDAALMQVGERAQQIVGVAVDTLLSNFVALDANDQPLTALIIYADTRNDADADALQARLDEREAHARTGCLLRTSYWPARLAWLKRTQPDVWQRAQRFVTFGEYLELRLFGQCRVSYSAASWSGLLDRRALQWDTPLLDALDVPHERFSPLVDVSEPLHGLREPYRSRWPALRDVPWFPAIGDGAAANIGSGCIGPDRVALTVGTTGAVRVVLPDDRPPTTDDQRHSSETQNSKLKTQNSKLPQGLWCYRVDGQRALLGGATSEGGNVYAWMQRSLRLDDPAALEAQIAAMPPDAHGLTILPLFAGERSPGWAGKATATISGLTLHTTSAEIARAALESIAYRFAIIATLLSDEGRKTKDESSVASDRSSFVLRPSSQTFVASGGALTSSPAWMQIMADVLQRPVIASAEEEATSRGAALLALESLGLASLDSLPANDGAMYTPNPQHADVYRAAVKRQQKLYGLLITS